MTRKRYSIDQLSTESARRAQNEAAIMQGDLKKLRDSLQSGGLSARSPKIAKKRTWTKKKTSKSFWNGPLGLLISGLDGDDLLEETFDLSGTLNSGVALSQAQKSSAWLEILSLGQRAR